MHKKGEPLQIPNTLAKEGVGFYKYKIQFDKNLLSSAQLFVNKKYVLSFFLIHQIWIFLILVGERRRGVGLDANNLSDWVSKKET